MGGRRQWEGTSIITMQINELYEWYENGKCPYCAILSLCSLHELHPRTCNCVTQQQWEDKWHSKHCRMWLSSCVDCHSESGNTLLWWWNYSMCRKIQGKLMRINAQCSEHFIELIERQILQNMNTHFQIHLIWMNHSVCYKFEQSQVVCLHPHPSNPQPVWQEPVGSLVECHAPKSSSLRTLWWQMRLSGWKLGTSEPKSTSSVGYGSFLVRISIQTTPKL